MLGARRSGVPAWAAMAAAIALFVVGAVGGWMVRGDGVSDTGAQIAFVAATPPIDTPLIDTAVLMQRASMSPMHWLMICHLCTG
ncbi:MAG: hypothetical protein HOI57_01820 [Rhodospirillaceae bacterium]|nr:hypothetical protein [Rhodospirillaceae bacterium]MBT7363510.1 hypothetical protein [Rhodospirillaceae bacterium]